MQRFITIDIDTQANILFTAPGNLFYRLTTQISTSAGAGKGTSAAIAVTDFQQYQTLVPVLATGSAIDSTQSITNMELYINNI